MIFDNSTGEMFYYSSFWPSDKYLDETKYTVREVDSDVFDSSLIYYLEDGEVKTKSGDTAERRKAEADAKKEWDAQEYARNRKEQYLVLNQFEMQYDDEVNGTTTWKDAIAKIKSDNPKPT